MRYRVAVALTGALLAGLAAAGPAAAVSADDPARSAQGNPSCQQSKAALINLSGCPSKDPLFSL